MSLVQDLQYAVELARGAGKIALDYFGRVERLTKTHAAAANEAVTEADRAVQRYIVAGLRRRYDGDGIVGEESETGTSITFDCPDPMGRNWVIDPIDGTNNFIGGFGAFAVCIGLLEAGEPVLGVVYDVCRDEVYSAARGHGAWLGLRRVSVNMTELSDASILMMTANALDRHGKLPGWFVRWLGQTNWKLRILGSAALEAAHVASGIAHGAVTVNGKLWDLVAAAALVLEAGGAVTDLTGRAIFPFDLAYYEGAKVPFLAAAPKAYVRLMEEIRGNP